MDDETGIPGDDDPLDACEIGSTIASCGEVKMVKPLGAFAIIDEGQTDWKAVVIDVHDPLAHSLFDIGDLDNALPGFLNSLQHWYRRYKVPDGKEENTVAFDGQVKNCQYAAHHSSVLGAFLSNSIAGLSVI